MTNGRLTVSRVVTPSRACGLKRIPLPARLGALAVTPSRACGLKLVHRGSIEDLAGVTPSRACGLKLCGCRCPFFDPCGHALAGVWIETASPMAV